MQMKIAIILCVVLAVALAANPDKEAKMAKKEARKQAKLARKAEKARCAPAVTWTACDANDKITQTISPTTAENCKSKKVTQQETRELDCTIIQTKEKNGCVYTRTADLRPCGNGQTTFMMTMTADKPECTIPANKASKTLECGRPVKVAKNKTRGGKKAGKAKKNGGGKRRGSRKECVYRAGKWSNCDVTANKIVMVRTLKRGDPGSCPATSVRERPCRRVRRDKPCKYKRGPWSSCDPVTNVKVMQKTLKRGNQQQCRPTMTIEKKCKRKQKYKVPPGCTYQRTVWGACDSVTHKKTMVQTLDIGDPQTCPPTQVKEKICKRKHAKVKEACRYRKLGRWGPCDPKTGLKSIESSLKNGDINTCALRKTLTKPCRTKSKPVKSACKYSKKPWSPCHAASNTVSRTLTLKAGNPAICNATKVETRKCTQRHLRPHLCKYRRTSWGECDPVTNMRRMVRTLKRGDTERCPSTQTMERKCKAKQSSECQYTNAPWSECDPVTNTITRRQQLKSGPATCPPVKAYSRKCKKLCKFTKGDWSDCNVETNMMTRNDPVKPGSHDSCPQFRALTKKCGHKKCIYDKGMWSECDSTDNPKRTRTQKLVSGDAGCKPEKVSSKSCKKKNGQERCFYGPWQEFEPCQNGVQKKIRKVVQGGLECERKSVKMKAC